MTIDVNASLGHWPFRKLSHNTAKGMVELMDGNGVTRAWVAMMDAIFYKDVQVANRDLAEAVKGFEDRLTPVAVINPNFPAWEEDLAECVERLGMKVVRLYPNYHDYALSDGCFSALMAKASGYGLIVCIAVRASDERMHHWRVKVPATSPKPLGKIAAAHPRTPIIACNVSQGDLGGVEGGIAPHANIFVEISHIEGVNGVGELAAQIGAGHVLFGSHAPYLYLKSAVLKMQEADLSEGDRAAIFSGNARRLAR